MDSGRTRSGRASAVLALAVVLAGLLAATGLVAASPEGPASPPRRDAVQARLPEPLRLVARGAFAALGVDGSDLLATRDVGQSSLQQVVRIDPTTGRQVAASMPAALVGGPALAGGRLWLEVGLGDSHYELVALDAATLSSDRIVPLHAASELVGLPDGELWLSSPACALQRVDPLSGALGPPLHPADAPCELESGMPGALYLLVLGLGLEKVDSRTGRLLARQAGVGFDGRANGMSVAEADGYLWIAGGSLTMPVALEIYATSDLHVVRRLLPPQTSGAGHCDTGRPFFGCPGWVEHDAGVIWGGGAGSGAIGCSDPATLAPVALEHGLDGLGLIVSVGRRLYALYPDRVAGLLTDIVAFRPPAACSRLLEASLTG